MTTAVILTRFKEGYCSGEVRSDVLDGMDITVVGKISERIQPNLVRYVAASPPDYRATYTGSGLPFANQEQAFYNSPNIGHANVVDGTFEIKLMYPNSYYVGLGTVLVPPSLMVFYVDQEGNEKEVTIKISEGIPYRTLTYPITKKAPRDSAMFYSSGWSLPVRTQEQVLRDSGYPSTNVMPDNHWGLKPPL